MTNEDLDARVKSGQFRLDLFYRLNVFPIAVPPLRRRREDVALLAEYFLERARELPPRDDGSRPRRLSPDAAAVLAAYSWPGNVRELRNVIERAAILAGSAGPDAALLRKILAPDLERQGEPGAGDLNLRRRVDGLERSLIESALAQTGGKKREAATLLGIDPRNFSYYLKKHALGDAETEAS
jgi:transcriptional regulator with GAF, ATPase, and Fis domain